ncbi:MAG: beta-N-acetylhexosaminidase, partial [Burkholderiales bacterium]|nr:beta-N-acetylhexosaminidase [Burkholderiales bacterium]
ATVTAIGAPAAKDWEIRPVDYVHALAELIKVAGVPIGAVMTAQNGYSTTLNGWIQSSVLGVKVLDTAGDVRAHPTGKLGGLGLGERPGYESLQVVSGGNRALHEDPAAVALLARALIQGLSQAGMAACGKHFPGHGAVAADSHLAIPVDDRPLDEILDADAAPYRWLGDLALPAVMPAHVIYPQVAPEPAGFSRRWVTDILRGRMEYDGVVFSDDLTMEGASVAGDIHARARAALEAGCDMVLVCNRPDLADELLAALADRPLDPQAVRRIRRLMPFRPAPDWTGLLSDPRYLRARSLRSENLSI